MATRNAAQRQPATAPRAKPPYCLLAVHRTAWIISACRGHQWRHQPSVRADHHHEYRPHANLLRNSSHRASSSPFSAGPDNSPTPGQQSTTTSTLFRSLWRSRACSLILRRNLFRVTALPTRFGIATPSRRGSLGRTRNRKPMHRRRNTLPPRYTARNAADWHIEQIGGRVHVILDRLCPMGAPCGLQGQALAPLSPAAAQNTASRRSRHTRAEAMGGLAFTAIGLVSD
jgi:hypothetical protein